MFDFFFFFFQPLKLLTTMVGQGGTRRRLPWTLLTHSSVRNRKKIIHNKQEA
jgi:hypothetical protein